MDGNYIGLMSGTSADSIDAVIVSITNQKLVLLDCYSHEIPKAIQQKIWQTNFSKNDELKTMLQLDYQLGILFADAVNHLLNKSSVSKHNIIAIGSHGQTLRHYPNGDYPSTLQIADANIIVEKTNIPTVGDFRRADIAAGGQGAPLAPAFHQFQFQHHKKNRIIVNIGGIANITYLPGNQSELIQGFDTGPGNCLMDEWIQQHQDKTYDKNGAWAKSGTIDKNLLNLLLQHSYFKEPKPKSTGRDIFNITWLNAILDNYHKNNSISNKDVQMTLNVLTAQSIVNDINLINNIDEVFICGGGVYNLTLMTLLQDLLSSNNIKCESTRVLDFNPDWVEACAFAWLAKQRLENQAGNCPSVTGANHPCILGAIYGATTPSYSSTLATVDNN